MHNTTPEPGVDVTRPNFRRLSHRRRPTCLSRSSCVNRGGWVRRTEGQDTAIATRLPWKHAPIKLIRVISVIIWIKKCDRFASSDLSYCHQHGAMMGVKCCVTQLVIALRRCGSMLLLTLWGGGWVGVKFPGKKRYVTLEWPHRPRFSDHVPSLATTICDLSTLESS